MYMKPSTVWLIALGLVSSLSAQGEQHSFAFHPWRIAADGSKRSAGDMCGSGGEEADFRIWIKPRTASGRATPFRLDADFVAHIRGDSSLLIGDITAAHAATPGPKVEPGDSAIHSQWDEESYRRTIVLRGAQSAWFYPLGVPQRGEEGIAFEISKDSVATCTVRADRIQFRANDRQPEVTAETGTGIGGFGIHVGGRLHRARVRLEVGSPAAGWRQVFESDVLTRMPTRIPLGTQGARGQDLIFELEAPEWGVPIDLQDEICWKWSWADHQPPSGGSCTATRHGTAVQRLFGSTAAQLRVTVLAAS
jgi:hypothetical protein